MPSLRETIKASLRKEEARRRAPSMQRDAREDPASQTRPIIMPKWGLSMKEGTVVSWQVDVGAEIAAGQEIMEIETSKIANTYESPVSGQLRWIVVQVGETVPVGALLGVCAPASISDDEIRTYVENF